MQNLNGRSAVAGGLLLAAMAVAIGITFATVRSDSELERGPTAAEVKAAVEGSPERPPDWASFDDKFYGLRVKHPGTWVVTSTDTGSPHRIRLEITRPVTDTEPIVTGTQPTAEITIQPYLSEPVSDARCEPPVETKISGRVARICTYSYGANYPNFEPTPAEWSVISVTLILDDGPVYISAAVLEPQDSTGRSANLPALRSHAADVMSIIGSIEVLPRVPAS